MRKNALFTLFLALALFCSANLAHASIDSSRSCAEIMANAQVAFSIPPIEDFTQEPLTLIAETDPILRLKAKAVSLESLMSPEVQNWITNLIKFMKQSGGVGIAAPQVGVPYQIIVVKLMRNPFLGIFKNKTTVLINPKLTFTTDKTRRILEGCLSLPGKQDCVTRHRAVRVEYLDINGESQVLETSDFSAIILQHEVDHLNGVLFTDY